jgi:hypothetical protein
MKELIGLILILSSTGCGICKNSDSPEVCRTKQRDHSHPRVELAYATVITARAVLVQ